MTGNEIRFRKRNLLVLSCFAVVILLSTAMILGVWSPDQGARALSYKGLTREFYLTNMDNPKINETLSGIPADIYNIPEMTVKKGDTVVIHFYNLESEATDRHSFAMLTGPYARNVVLDGGQNQTISFIANQTGIFTYACMYHTPSMTGQLVVTLPTIDEFRAQQKEQQNIDTIPQVVEEADRLVGG